jgi:hypothetical protein
MFCDFYSSLIGPHKYLLRPENTINPGRFNMGILYFQLTVMF